MMSRLSIFVAVLLASCRSTTPTPSSVVVPPPVQENLFPLKIEQDSEVEAAPISIGPAKFTLNVEVACKSEYAQYRKVPVEISIEPLLPGLVVPKGLNVQVLFLKGKKDDNYYYYAYPEEEESGGEIMYKGTVVNEAQSYNAACCRWFVTPTTKQWTLIVNLYQADKGHFITTYRAYWEEGEGLQKLHVPEPFEFDKTTLLCKIEECIDSPKDLSSKQDTGEEHKYFCVICLDGFDKEEDAFIPACGDARHSLCLECSDNYIRNYPRHTCPLCKKEY